MRGSVGENSRGRAVKQIPSISVGILAGGNSSRMGTNKALLRFGNHTVIERIIAEFCDDYEVMISAAQSETYSFLNLPVVCDENKSIGPIEGIRRLLIVSKNNFVFVCATDMPFVDKELVNYLASFIRSDTDCCVLTVGGIAEPLCSIYSKKVIPIIEKLIEQGHYRPRKIYNFCSVQYIPLETSGLNPSIAQNMNTPENYQQFAEQFKKVKLRQ